MLARGDLAQATRTRAGLEDLRELLVCALDGLSVERRVVAVAVAVVAAPAPPRDLGPPKF